MSTPKYQIPNCLLPKISTPKMSNPKLSSFKVAYSYRAFMYMTGTVSTSLSYCGHHLFCLAIRHMAMFPFNSFYRSAIVVALAARVRRHHCQNSRPSISFLFLKYRYPPLCVHEQCSSPSLLGYGWLGS